MFNEKLQDELRQKAITSIHEVLNKHNFRTKDLLLIIAEVMLAVGIREEDMTGDTFNHDEIARRYHETHSLGAAIILTSFQIRDWLSPKQTNDVSPLEDEQ